MYLDKTFSNDLFYGYYGRGYKRLIVTTPSYVMDPTITITATGYTQISNSITVLEGTSVSYTVSGMGTSPAVLTNTGWALVHGERPVKV